MEVVDSVVLALTAPSDCHHIHTGSHSLGGTQAAQRDPLDLPARVVLQWSDYRSTDRVQYRTRVLQ